MNKFNWQTATYQEVADNLLAEYLQGNKDRITQQTLFYKRMLAKNPNEIFYVGMVEKLTRVVAHLKYLKMKAAVVAYEEDMNA